MSGKKIEQHKSDEYFIWSWKEDNYNYLNFWLNVLFFVLLVLIKNMLFHLTMFQYITILSIVVLTIFVILNGANVFPTYDYSRLDPTHIFQTPNSIDAQAIRLSGVGGLQHVEIGGDSNKTEEPIFGLSLNPLPPRSLFGNASPQKESVPEAIELPKNSILVSGDHGLQALKAEESGGDQMLYFDGSTILWKAVDVDLNALPSAHIHVGNEENKAVAVKLTGALTLDSSGLSHLGRNAISEEHIVYQTIHPNKLVPGENDDILKTLGTTVVWAKPLRQSFASVVLEYQPRSLDEIYFSDHLYPFGFDTMRTNGTSMVLQSFGTGTAVTTGSFNSVSIGGFLQIGLVWNYMTLVIPLATAIAPFDWNVNMTLVRIDSSTLLVDTLVSWGSETRHKQETHTGLNWSDELKAGFSCQVFDASHFDSVLCRYSSMHLTEM
jgi:hypothetical protein